MSKLHITTLPVKKRTQQPSPALQKRREKENFVSRIEGKKQGIKLLRIPRNRVFVMAFQCGLMNKGISELARILGVSRATLVLWMSHCSRIRKEWQRGVDAVMMEVERAGIKRAKGYKYRTAKCSIERDINGHIIRRTRTVETVHVEPDPSMIRYMLDRRMPKRYKPEEEKPSTILLQIDGEDSAL